MAERIPEGFRCKTHICVIVDLQRQGFTFVSGIPKLEWLNPQTPRKKVVHPAGRGRGPKEYWPTPPPPRLNWAGREVHLDPGKFGLPKIANHVPF